MSTTTGTNDGGLKKIYDKSVKDGYKGSFDDFTTYFNASEENRRRVYDKNVKKGYKGSYDDFISFAGAGQTKTQPTRYQIPTYQQRTIDDSPASILSPTQLKIARGEIGEGDTFTLQPGEDIEAFTPLPNFTLEQTDEERQQRQQQPKPQRQTMRDGSRMLGHNAALTRLAQDNGIATQGFENLNELGEDAMKIYALTPQGKADKQNMENAAELAYDDFAADYLKNGSDQDIKAQLELGRQKQLLEQENAALAKDIEAWKAHPGTEQQLNALNARIRDLNKRLGEYEAAVAQSDKAQEKVNEAFQKWLENDDYYKAVAQQYEQNYEATMGDWFDSAATPLYMQMTKDEIAKMKAYLDDESLNLDHRQRTAIKRRVKDAEAWVKAAEKNGWLDKTFAGMQGKGAGIDIATMFRGMGNSLTIDRLSFGIGDALDARAIEKAMVKVRDQGVESLTPEERALLESDAVLDLTKSMFNVDESAFNAGATTMEMLPFIAELWLSGGANAAIKAGVKGAIKGGAKGFGKGLKAGWKAAMKPTATQLGRLSEAGRFAPKTVGQVAKEVGMTAAEIVDNGLFYAMTTGLGHSIANTLEYMTPEMDSKYDFGTGKWDVKGVAVDEQGNIKGGDKLGLAALKGFGMQAIEGGSEMLGEKALQPLLDRAGYGLRKLMGGNGRAMYKPYLRVVDDWIGHGALKNISGFGTEYAEELAGSVMRVITGLSTWDQEFNKQNLADTAYGLMPAQVAFAILGGGRMVGHARRSSQAKDLLDKYAPEQAAFYDRVAQMSTYDGADMLDRKTLEILKTIDEKKNNGTLTEEDQRKAAAELGMIFTMQEQIYMDEASAYMKDKHGYYEGTQISRRIYEGVTSNLNKDNGMFTVYEWNHDGTTERVPVLSTKDGKATIRLWNGKKQTVDLKDLSFVGEYTPEQAMEFAQRRDEEFKDYAYRDQTTPMAGSVYYDAEGNIPIVPGKGEVNITEVADNGDVTFTTEDGTTRTMNEREFYEYMRALRDAYEVTAGQLAAWRVEADTKGKTAAENNDPQAHYGVGREARMARRALANAIGEERMAELERMDGEQLTREYMMADEKTQDLMYDWMQNRVGDSYGEAMSQRRQQAMAEWKQRIGRLPYDNGNVTTAVHNGNIVIVEDNDGQQAAIVDMAGNKSMVQSSELSNMQDNSLDSVAAQATMPQQAQLTALERAFNGTTFQAEQEYTIGTDTNGEEKKAIIVSVNEDGTISYATEYGYDKEGNPTPAARSVKVATAEGFRDMTENARQQRATQEQGRQEAAQQRADMGELRNGQRVTIMDGGHPVQGTVNMPYTGSQSVFTDSGKLVKFDTIDDLKKSMQDAANALQTEQQAAIEAVANRINELANAMPNASIKVVTDINELRPDAQGFANQGRLEAYFDPDTNTVVFYAPGLVANNSNIDGKVIHEVVIHYGLKNMLGEKDYAALCLNIFNNVMDDNDKAQYVQYVKDSHPDSNLTDEQIMAIAADEWLAFTYENRDIDSIKRESLLQTIVNFIVDLFKKAGVDLNREEVMAELDQLVAASRDWLRGEQVNQEEKKEEALKEEEKKEEPQPEPAKTREELIANAVQAAANFAAQGDPNFVKDNLDKAKKRVSNAKKRKPTSTDPAKRQEQIEKINTELAAAESELAFWNDVQAVINEAQLAGQTRLNEADQALQELEANLNPTVEAEEVHKFDKEPANADEAAADFLVGFVKKEHRINEQSLMQETNWSEDEVKNFRPATTPDGGMTLQEAAENLYNEYESEGSEHGWFKDPSEARDKLVSVMQEAGKYGELANYINQRRGNDEATQQMQAALDANAQQLGYADAQDMHDKRMAEAQAKLEELKDEQGNLSEEALQQFKDFTQGLMIGQEEAPAEQPTESIEGEGEYYQPTNEEAPFSVVLPIDQQTPKNTTIDQVLYSIKVNHNSPYLLKKADGSFIDPETGEHLGFDHRFMSTGEGIQAHGWGSYFSVEDLRHYADDLNNPNTPPMRAAMRQQGRRWLEENPTFEAWKETKEFKDYYYNHEDSAFKYIEELKTRGPEWQADIEDIEKRIEERRRQREDEDYLRKQYGIEREAALTQSSRHHYDVEIPDDNGTNYFEENEPMKPEQIAMIQAQSDKEGAKAEVGGFLFYANPEKNPYADRYTFRKFLNDITSDMGGGLTAQQASEFFHRAGFTGIHYYGSRDGEGYVIFDENDAKIVDHVMFSVTGLITNGEIDNDRLNDIIQSVQDGQGSVSRIPSGLRQENESVPAIAAQAIAKGLFASKLASLGETQASASQRNEGRTGRGTDTGVPELAPQNLFGIKGIGEQDREEVRNLIKQWAKENGYWFDEERLQQMGDEMRGGTESRVFRSEDGTTISKSTNAFNYQGNVQLVIESMEMFGKVFPNTPYTIIGFAEDKNGNLCVVATQPYVQGMSIDEYAKQNDWFDEYGNVDYDKKMDFLNRKMKEQYGLDLVGAVGAYENDTYHVFDIHSGNYIVDNNGDISVIDADISLNNESDYLDDGVRFSVVTPQQDADYMDAVNRGDMETAQRMVLEAAKAAMPNTKVVDENGNPLVVYHGTRTANNIRREGFSREMSGKGNRGADNQQFYFTSSYENAVHTGIKAEEFEPLIDIMTSVYDLFGTTELPTTEELYAQADALRKEASELREKLWRVKDDSFIKKVLNKILNFLNIKTKTADEIRTDYAKLIKSLEEDVEELYRKAEIVGNFNSGMRYLKGDRHNLVNTLHYINEAINSDSPFRQFAANKLINLVYGMDGLEYSPDVIPVFLNIEHPLETDFGYKPTDRNPLLMGVFSPENWAYQEREGRLLDELKSDKYDGSISKNKFDVLFGDVYIAKSPSQIKSADPVTYDDQGNVIPLSERFNEGNDDIRYSVVSPQQDAAYMQAVENGDMEAAQRMVDEAAREAGYISDNDFRMSHTAPNGRDGFAKSIATPEGIYPEDLYSPQGYNYYGDGDVSMDKESANIFKRLRGNPEALVKIYRAVPKSLKETKLRNGDWVTINRRYAQEHGENNIDGGYKIIEDEVPAKFVYTDGNSLHEQGYDDGNEYAYQNTKNNRKLLDAVTYDDEGNVIPLSKRFNKRSDDIRYSIANANQAIFVSNAARAVEGIKQEKATPEQWLKMIEKNGGLKAGEDKWLGLSQWLKDSDAKTLTKQEVLDFINENAIKIEETRYTEAPQSQTDRSSLTIDEVPEAMREGMNALNEEFKERVRIEREDPNSTVWGARNAAFDYMVDKYDGKFADAFGIRGENLTVRNAFYLKDAAEILGVDIDETINPTRLQYTTEGLDNKREIALTVPTIEPWNENDDIHFGDAGEGRAVAWVRFGETTDADGNRVLVIDEIQSKRHQEGREKGYYDKEAREELKEFREQLKAKYPQGYLSFDISDEDYERSSFLKGSARLTKDELDKLISLKEKAGEVEGKLQGIPAAPFEKNWMELAMKRMLRLAAEEGYDKVAWTTGEQQAERYNIGKVVDAMEVRPYKAQSPSESDGHDLTVHLSEGTTWEMFVQPDGTLNSDNELFDGKNVTEVFGKELGERIMSVTEPVLRLDNEDLRVGAEGMKGFYDKMIPSFMNKYGKQWGVKVGEVTMPNLEEGYQTMHSIDVNEQMKESVMNGQLMFSFVGRSGAQRLDMADRAMTRLNNLHVAREMEEQGKDAKAVKMATGWERGKDGKWRYEISDENYRFDRSGLTKFWRDNPVPKEMRDLVLKKGRTEEETKRLEDYIKERQEKMKDFMDHQLVITLEDVISHDELFKAYPQLKNIKVTFTDTNSNNYDRSKGTLYGYYDDGNKEIVINKDLMNSEKRSTLIHEIQHAIQYIEGFAKGGNPSTTKQAVDDVVNNAKIWGYKLELDGVAKDHPEHADSEQELLYDILFDYLGYENDGQAEYNARKDGWIPEENLRKQAFKIFKGRINGEAYEKAHEKYIGRMQERGSTQFWNGTPFELYKRLAGETEARNVQTRLGFTDEQRRQLLAAETEDVAREDQLVMFAGDPVLYSVSQAANTPQERLRLYDAMVGTKEVSSFVGRVTEGFYQSVVDGAIPLKRLQDVIAGRGKVTDAENAYLMEIARAARAKRLTDEAETKYYEPMMKAIAALTGKTTKKGYYKAMRDVELYVLAKSGLERNQWFWDEAKKSDPNAQLEDKSGLTALAAEFGEKDFTAFAQRLVADYEARHGQQKIDELWKCINAVSKNILDTELDGHLISQELHDDLLNRWKFYVPMRGFDEQVTSAFYAYQPSSATIRFENPFKKIKGRVSLADNPFVNLIRMTESAINLKGKNEVGLALLNLAASHDDNGLLRVGKAWEVKEVDPATGEVTWKAAYPNLSNVSQADIPAAIDAFQKAMLRQAKTGDARPSSRTAGGVRIHPSDIDQHVLKVKVGGQTVDLYLLGNPKAFQALNPTGKSKAGEKLSGLTRSLSGLMTTYNPVFMVRNSIRDFKTAAIITYTRDGAAGMFNMMGQWFGNMNALRKLIKGESSGDATIDQYWQEFLEFGGETGFTRSLNMEKQREDFNKKMFNLTRDKSGQAMHKITHWYFDWMSQHGNRYAEDITRFAVFCASRKQGRSAMQAAADAKNTTANFNKKGQSGFARFMSTNFAFFNAAIQGLNTSFHAFKDNPGRAATAAVSTMIYSMAIPFVNTCLLAMFGDDDDWRQYENMTQFVSNTHAVYYIPGAGFLTMPYPQDFVPFTSLGNIIWRNAAGFEKTLNGRSIFGNVMLQWFDTWADLLPVNAFEEGFGEMKDWKGVARALAPTWLSPVADVMLNRNFMGSQIRRKHFTLNDQKDLAPYWAEYDRNKNWWAYEAARLIAGGDEYRAAAAWRNVDPRQLIHLVEGYGGGTVKLVSDIAVYFEEMAKGDKPTLNQAPFIKKFWIQPNPDKYEGNLNGKLYEMAKYQRELEQQIKDLQKEADKAREDGNDKAAEKREKKIEEIQNSMEYKILTDYDVNGMMKDWREERNDITNDETLSEEGKQDKIVTLTYQKAAFLDGIWEEAFLGEEAPKKNWFSEFYRDASTEAYTHNREKKGEQE